MIDNTEEAVIQLEKEMDALNASNDNNLELSGVNILEEKEVDGHKLWRYVFQGQAIPRTRLEQWFMDDGNKYSIFQCFDHSIEQVVRNEVKGPFHSKKDDAEANG